MRYPAKIKLGNHKQWAEHRSGWGYAISQLQPLFAEEGVFLETFIENKFSFDVLDGRVKEVVPYAEPWIGFLHHPPGIPEWYQYDSAPQRIFEKPAWLQSLPLCRGLIVFSRWMERWLAERVEVPTLALVHPTELSSVTFSWDAFRANPTPSVVQVGFWLRRFHAIDDLPVHRLRKACLNPMLPSRQHLLDRVIAAEREVFSRPPHDTGAVHQLPFLPHDGYDRLLSENIVFLEFYDAVANNTVVECIVRETPLLVNPLPSVVEYLGEEYPFYFRLLDEAAKKAEDPGCVKAAHDYLHALPKTTFSGAHFLQSFAESGVYASL